MTLGPSIFEIEDLGAMHRNNYIYRINGAHGDVNSIREYVTKIRSAISGAKVLMDLPGNKVRTYGLNTPIALKNGEHFAVSPSNLNYPDFYKHLKVGDTVHANDSVFTFTVDSIEDNGDIVFMSHSDGTLLNNKGMHVRGIHDDIPFLFERDLRLIDIANEMENEYIGLSFVRNIDDVRIAKERIKSAAIICKVETKRAVENLNSLLDENEIFLIDRGDLSTEVGLLGLAKYQRHIIEKAMQKNKKLFLATQFLKNMEVNPIPSIAEAIDLVNTLKMGICGIQLSEETAVGKYPQRCLAVIEEAQQAIAGEII